ncbi:peptide-methionine (S)-S-oxide reductase MsrA [Parapedobacter sp.]
MNTKVIIGAVILLALSFAFMASRMIKSTQHNEQSREEDKLHKQVNNKHMANGKKVYIAGGCFWGMEDLFRKQKGVLDTEVGYIGGENENPTYNNHPGHAEGIEITYDTTETDFKEILDYFFRIHNPTTVNQQGNDIGSSYRSAIFYQNEEEKQTAQEMIDIVNQSNRWDGKVVTTLEPYTKFWPAEDYHQDYLVKNPNGYTCHFERFGTFLDNE